MKISLAILFGFFAGAGQDPGLKAGQKPEEYAAAMKAVAKKFKGTPGVYLQIGDQLLYTNQSTAWARAGRDLTAEEQAFLKWTHAGEKNDQDGWWLAAVDRPTGRSDTAAGGVTASALLKGGHNGLPSLAELLKKYKPQMAFYMVGGNDIVWGQPVPAEQYIVDVEKAVELLLENGTIPILSTLPPFTGKGAIIDAYNKALRQLARKKKLPLADLYAEMKARAGAQMEANYIAPDGKHLTIENCAGPATDENLKRYFFLLRCYVAVHKGMEVKAAVLDAK